MPYENYIKYARERERERAKPTSPLRIF
jgi:hypothetical protein